MKTISMNDFKDFKKEIILASEKNLKLVAIYSADNDNISYSVTSKTKGYVCDYLMQAIEIFNSILNYKKVNEIYESVN